MCRMIWKAISTGEIDEEVWDGADNNENHYGFMFRLLMLFMALGVAIYMLSKIPEVFRLVGY